ncbi:Pyruvate/Phosphoenolpyruvate kinase-like domain-containing protein [Bisporella sp. PMI_857]|nr:Pyruvate/Phosphoenolpyruvate kinase-like domain-containing protein [Bisporella sp. PMI_857]
MSSELRTAIVSNTGKTRLRASLERAQAGGQPSVGQWIDFPGYTLAKTVAGLGFDWVLVDCEHGNISDNEMYLAVGAIASAGASPIVRVPANEAWMIKRALDAGAHGIMIPMCETKEQAVAIVNAMKYPSAQWPKGFRGAGAMFAPALFEQNGRDYLTNSNDNILVIVQIETRLGVENVEDIAKTDGIDALFIGPNDLAASLGYFALDHAKIEEVQVATAKILKAAKDAGKFSGHFGLSGEIAAQRAKQGFEFVNCGMDVLAIQAWMGSEFAKMKELLAEK